METSLCCFSIPWLIPVSVCPTCSNMLRVSAVPPGDPTTEDFVGQNRFECLTCPYHFVINKRYYERKYMKKKEVEDILGGKGAWDNVDKTEGMLRSTQAIAAAHAEADACKTVQCPNEKCRNHEAYWYQLQIRSADEPMTAFYKVSLHLPKVLAYGPLTDALQCTQCAKEWRE